LIEVPFNKIAGPIIDHQLISIDLFARNIKRASDRNKYITIRVGLGGSFEVFDDNFRIFVLIGGHFELVVRLA